MEKTTEKAIEIAENAKLPLSLNEADDVLRAINICSKKGYFKSAVKYGALTMAQCKDMQHKQEKQQLFDKVCEWLEENAHKFVCTKPYPYNFTTTKSSPLYCGYANKALIDNLKKQWNKIKL